MVGTRTPGVKPCPEERAMTNGALKELRVVEFLARCQIGNMKLKGFAYWAKPRGKEAWGELIVNVTASAVRSLAERIKESPLVYYRLEAGETTLRGLTALRIGNQLDEVLPDDPRKWAWQLDMDTATPPEGSANGG